MRILVAIFTLAFSINANAISHKYKDEFAFFCKSFHRDVKRTVNLYQSIEQHYKGSAKFYIVIPKKDEKLFKDEYDLAIKSGIIKTRPIIMFEDDIFRKCEIPSEKIKHLGQKNNRGGWNLQQVVKLCIGSLELAKNYVTIDSDMYFIKDFDESIFYDKSGVLFTAAGKYFGSFAKAVKKLHKIDSLYNTDKEQSYRFYSHSFIKYTLDGGQKPWYDFVQNYGLFQSDILFDMRDYIKTKMRYDFSDLINMVPWEFQWYGEFVLSQKPEKFFPYFADEFSMGIGDMYEDSKFKHCSPTNGYPGQYAIAYQPHAIGRKEGQIRYEMPNTLKCKIQSNTKITFIKLKRFFGL